MLCALLTAVVVSSSSPTVLRPRQPHAALLILPRQQSSRTGLCHDVIAIVAIACTQLPTRWVCHCVAFCRFLSLQLSAADLQCRKLPKAPEPSASFIVSEQTHRAFWTPVTRPASRGSTILESPLAIQRLPSGCARHTVLASRQNSFCRRFGRRTNCHHSATCQLHAGDVIQLRCTKLALGGKVSIAEPVKQTPLLFC